MPDFSLSISSANCIGGTMAVEKSSPDEKLIILAVGAGCRARGCFEYPVKVGEVFESAIKTDFEDLLGACA
jgi:hypothetical protein